MLRRARAPFAVSLAAVAVSLAAPARAADSALAVGVGLGVAFPSDPDVDGSASGGYGKVEYIRLFDHWISPRAYAGLLLAAPDRDECGAGVAPCDVSARIGFVGGKLRLMAPLPYAGPFVELGLGASIGRLTTRSGPVDVAGSGVMWHVPWSIGIAFGERHQYELGLEFLEHPDQEQTASAFSFAFAFGL
jgi:hypothetical protein